MVNFDTGNLNSMDLDSLEKLQELIKDRVDILKGRESLINSKTYSNEEMRELMSKCLKN